MKSAVASLALAVLILARQRILAVLRVVPLAVVAIRWLWRAVLWALDYRRWR